jgi:hypothetical protein
MFSFEDSNFAV